MMVPTRLADWTLDTVKALLQRGVKEAERFDFKEALPHKSNASDKDKLRQACAAFANSGGGFLVFGVADSGTPWESRLVGLQPSLDFPEHFGTFPEQCRPSVRWDFTNPGFSLPNGNVVYVVHVVGSSIRPHAISAEKPSQALLFPKRTNKGTEFMSYDEVRSDFLQHYEKVIQLQHLVGELEHIVEVAQRIVGEASGHQQVPDVLGVRGIVFSRFDVTIVEQVTSNVFSIIADRTDLVRQLRFVRERCRRANNMIDFAYQVLQHGNLGAYNDKIIAVAQEVMQPARTAQDLLKTALQSR